MDNNYTNDKYLPHQYWRFNVLWDVGKDESLYTCYLQDETEDNITVTDARDAVREIPKSKIVSSVQITKEQYSSFRLRELEKLKQKGKLL